MHPELESYLTACERLGEDAARLAGALGDEQFNWRPAPERWSIAQCLMHLNRQGYWYLPFIDGSIRDARQRGLTGSGPFRHPFFWNLFIRQLEPPVKLKVKAPPSLAPQPTGGRGTVLPQFLALQDELRARIRQANGLDLARAHVRSPITSLLNISLGQVFALLAAHGRRHLWQAWQVRNDPRFPVVGEMPRASAGSSL